MTKETTKPEATTDQSAPVDALVRPRIIQLLMTPNDATWQGNLLGLGSDGATYFAAASGRWEPYIPPLTLRLMSIYPYQTIKKRTH